MSDMTPATAKSISLLGLPGRPRDTRVVVAMSGGVDSSVVAGLLREEGYDVVGITLQLYDHGAAVAKKGACCAGQDIHDARRVADRLGIPHFVLDYENRFREQVMEDFADTYLAGGTPIPCVRCNQSVKFHDLLGMARDLGAAALATGHYVRRVEGAEGVELHRGADESRDQSYFLFATTRAQLDFLRFPLGGLPKSRTREIAERLGLAVADKPDSQDICFVPQGRYTSVIERLRPGAAEPGEIVDMDGKVLGRHAGIIHYTVGQRRGIGVAVGEPLYVVRLDAARRQVVVGPEGALKVSRIVVSEVNWLGPVATPGACHAVSVKVRSTRPPVPATVTLGPDRRAVIDLHDGEVGVAPGQAAVFYDCETPSWVLGGGWIRETATAVDREARVA